MDTQPSPTKKAPDAAGLRLPATAYVWFALLCIGAIWSRLPDAPRMGAALSRTAADTGGANVKKGDGARVDSGSAQAFSDYVQAEQVTRTALAGPYLSRSLTGFAREAGRPAGAPKPNRPDDPQRQAQKLYDDAIRKTRELAERTGSMNFARRVLVLEHAAGRPLDGKFLTGTLAANLKKRGKDQEAIRREIGFWRGLYGAKAVGGDWAARYAASLPEDFDLGLLQKKLRADIARSQGDVQAAQRQEREVGATAARSFLSSLALGILAILAGIVGIVLLVIIVVFAAQRNLVHLRTEPIPEARLSPALWGGVLDIFVFYFALLFISRPVLGLVADAVLPSGPRAISPNVAVAATVVSSFAVQGIAVLYAWIMLRRRGLSFDVVGLSGRHLLANVGWGVLGYCVALPLLFVLGQVASALFQNNPNVTPNPALPLLTSAEGLGPRLLIFALVAIGAPLFEEFFFRGVLYTGLRARWGVAASIVVSAALFAIGHPVQDWLPIFGLGVAFAALRECRQSIVPGMVAHFLQNGLVFLTLSALFSR